MSNTRLVTLVGIILVAAASRLVPHPANFTPLAAIALFGGASFVDRRTAFLVPLAAMIVSDLFLGVHRLIPVVYLCFVATVAIGRLIAERRSVISITAAALASSLLFFVVTNFGVWATSQLYPQTAAGLFACYVAAIPFFQATLVGDLCYTAVLFGSFALAERWVPVLRRPVLG